MTKKIVFLTGTRADFGKLSSLMDAIDREKDFECHIFVTGMHTLEKYGNTFEEVQKNGYKNITIFHNQLDTNKQDIILANTIVGFSKYINEIHPNMIIVHGDRIEALAGAIVGSFNNILVAHIEGGEISGTVDELIRHAITKLSHVHFAANDDAKKRLIQLGESKDSIFVIGSPDIEVMTSVKLPSIETVKKHYKIPFNNFAVFIFHPVTTELNSLHSQISEVISALIDSKKNYVVIYPNNDTGTEIILDEIKRIEGGEKFSVFPSIRFLYFLTILKNAQFIIGNSSAAIREAEVFGTPAINIGTRQLNRSKNKDIVNVKPNKKSILEAIRQVENKRLKEMSFFGYIENTTEKFVDTLHSSSVWSIPIQKQFIDIHQN
ncbi:MAG: UDP-N-acetylglucosamine 2-epimerase (hydrolyzing) [Crenarchaeota archaeon]|nr:MAG: UDP-N-acetylglucosamine 2-epimerase (hydrolyzing) [Thermoproteota archaeon]RDJ33311.1 MAG: UDP-N-acetylglucosamine 2-epimerase (hydrolyzing) [Thermoproteota archaeon]RDJ36186.1 MAG: UDP-N-acetylglucosamine 2-epimerase (hydrolyzing) [Thermoproteota archaeon]RDJ38817.1 MAG: UDP-N-acetylglucosamine 2-epimerase (hydrolyzing) [Thermoproteota archaeon]